MDVSVPILLLGLLSGHTLSKKTHPLATLLLAATTTYLGLYTGKPLETFTTPFSLGLATTALIMLLKGGIPKTLTKTISTIRKAESEKKRELQELRREVGDIKQIEKELAGFYREVREFALGDAKLDRELETALAAVEKELEEIAKTIREFFRKAYSLWGRIDRKEALLFWKELTQQVKEHLLKAMEKLEVIIREYVAGVKRIREEINNLDEKTDQIARNLLDLRKRLIDTAKLEIRSFEQVDLVLEKIEVGEYEDLAKIFYKEHTAAGFGAFWAREENRSYSIGEELHMIPKMAREIKASIQELKENLQTARNVDLAGKVEEASKLLADVQGKLAGKNDIESKALAEISRIEEEVKGKVKSIYSGYVEAAIKERFGPDTALRAFWSGLEKVEEEILPSLRAIGRVSRQMALEYGNVEAEIERALNDVEASLNEAVSLDQHMQSVLSKAKKLNNELAMLEKKLVMALELGEAKGFKQLGKKLLADLKTAREIWKETVKMIREEKEAIGELKDLKTEIHKVKEEVREVFGGIAAVLNEVAEKVSGEALVKEFQRVKARIARVITESLREIEALKKYLSEEVKREELAKVPAK